MNKRRIVSFSLIMGLFLTIAIFNLVKYKVEAADVILPDEYYFVFNGQEKPQGTEFALNSPQILLNVTSGTWEPATTVQWISSEPGVVAIENTTFGTNFVNLVRKGPGYSTVTAVIKQGDNSYTISCVIKVGLEIDYQKTGLITATTTKERLMVFDSISQQKQVYLKYLDYTTSDQASTVTGAAITTTAVTWSSSDESVATVDTNGIVKSIGSGSATITATTNTLSSQDKALSVSVKIVVKPVFSVAYDDSTGMHHNVSSVEAPNLVTSTEGIANAAPSDFVLQSNSSIAGNLKWEVYDYSTKQKLTAGTSSKMTYTVSSISGNVSFSNVKAGTYEIYAFVDDNYNANTNAPYAYMKVIVPIDVGDKSIVMTVGDTYNLIDNSNVTGSSIFEYYYDEGNSNIARIDQNTGIITAKTQGQVKLRLAYKSANNLYDNATVVSDIILNITVIDGIALNTTSATLFTKGTIMLSAIVTNPTSPITWSSSDTSIATVTNGVVTGVKAGTVVITAKQTINGIVKKATCEITVQQSVSTITIDPATATLAIGGYQTLHAIITPANLNGVTLKWKSSNDAVVKIIESNALTATIQGVSGGNAVISAINQDNVVVGYCHVSVNQPVTSIVLSETSVEVSLASKTLQLRATVYPENALNKAVTWSSTDTTKAKVDVNGNVTLLKPGTVSIIATSVDNPNARAICNLTIDIPVVSITLDETEKIMYVGQSARLSYVILPTNSSNNTVLWTSTNTSVATVDTTGKVTAKNVGTTVIMLKTLDGGFSAYCTITVKKVATGVKFDVTELTLKAGEYYYIQPTLNPKDSTDTGLTWESSDTKVAVVDDKGKVVAKDAGTAVIMARTEAGGVAYCKVTVTRPVNGLILNYTDKTIYAGDSFKLKVSVSPSSASQLGVTWKSSNPKVATVDKNGVVDGLLGGVTVITATTLDGGYSDTCVVTVREYISSIKLNYSSYRLGISKTVILKATVSTNTASNKKVTWRSSNTKVATVNSMGKVTGISLGYATITATTTDGSDVEASCDIRIVRPVTSVTLNDNYVALLVGDSKDLNATVRPSNSTYRGVNWKSSDSSVAIVDEDGVITALKAGDVTITANARDSSGKKSVCYVTVRDRLASTGVAVMDKSLTMVPGESKIVQVALNPAASTDGFYWSSDNTAVANVNKYTGKITARATGTANITVMTDSGKTALVEVTVIGLNMTSLVLEQYTTYPYPLQVEGATGTVKWTIDHPEVAVVTNGTVSSRASGTATITAQVNGRKLTCKLKVVKIK